MECAASFGFELQVRCVALQEVGAIRGERLGRVLRDKLLEEMRVHARDLFAAGGAGAKLIAIRLALTVVEEQVLGGNQSESLDEHRVEEVGGIEASQKVGVGQQARHQVLVAMPDAPHPTQMIEADVIDLEVVRRD